MTLAISDVPPEKIVIRSRGQSRMVRQKRRLTMATNLITGAGGVGRGIRLAVVSVLALAVNAATPITFQAPRSF